MWFGPCAVPRIFFFVFRVAERGIDAGPCRARATDTFAAASSGVVSEAAGVQSWARSEARIRHDGGSAGSVVIHV